MDVSNKLLLLIFAHAVYVLAPGPAFVLITHQTLQHGRKRGLTCAVGLTIAISIHILLAYAGLVLILDCYEAIMPIFKMALAGCFLYLGYQGFIKQKLICIQFDIEKKSEQTLSNGLLLGLFCNVFNPAVPIYCVSIFTLILSDPMPQSMMMSYWLVMIIIQIVWYGSLILVLSNSVLVRNYSSYSVTINRIFGLTMHSLGITTITNSMSL